jgi:hypothetical protein
MKDELVQIVGIYGEVVFFEPQETKQTLNKHCDEFYKKEFLESFHFATSSCSARQEIQPHYYVNKIPSLEPLL